MEFLVNHPDFNIQRFAEVGWDIQWNESVPRGLLNSGQSARGLPSDRGWSRTPAPTAGRA